MNGKTNKMKRRLAIAALAASIAAVTIPAASGSPYRLDPGGSVDGSLSTATRVSSSEIVREASQEHGANGFNNDDYMTQIRVDDQKANAQSINQEAAQEHGAAGFGNVSGS